MLSICTVLPRSEPGFGICFGSYSLVSNRVFMSVDFPRPDSPENAALVTEYARPEVN